MEEIFGGFLNDDVDDVSEQDNLYTSQEVHVGDGTEAEVGVMPDYQVVSVERMKDLLERLWLLSQNTAVEFFPFNPNWLAGLPLGVHIPALQVLVDKHVIPCSNLLHFVSRDVIKRKYDRLISLLTRYGYERSKAGDDFVNALHAEGDVALNISYAMYRVNVMRASWAENETIAHAMEELQVLRNRKREIIIHLNRAMKLFHSAWSCHSKVVAEVSDLHDGISARVKEANDHLVEILETLGSIRQSFS